MKPSSGSLPRVAVIMGGPSGESRVSRASGRQCADALRGEGFEVAEIEAAIGPDLVSRLGAAAPDVVFNAMHGRWGEDGRVQGLLEWLQIPYTHSGVLASALAMDKQRAKAAMAAAGIAVPDSRIHPLEEVRAGHVRTPPYVVKPNSEGSSLGVSIVPDSAPSPPTLQGDLPERVLVEDYVPGRELTVAVLGDRSLAVTEILTDGWYDYDAKYETGGSRHVVPAEVPDDIGSACLDWALAAHRTLGCRGLSRTDFRWDDTRGADGLFAIEINTQPGMTATSLAPEQAEAAGISLGEMCAWLVRDASCER